MREGTLHPSWAHSAPKTGTGSTGREASALTYRYFPLPVASVIAKCKSFMWFKIWSHVPFSSAASKTPSLIWFSCPISVLGKLWPTPSSLSSLSERSCMNLGMILFDFVGVQTIILKTRYATIYDKHVQCDKTYSSQMLSRLMHRVGRWMFKHVLVQQWMPWL